MDKAPVEIWEHIFSLACTDGGETGRALSAVSRYFRSASARYKHQYVVVATPAQANALTAQLERSLPQLRRVLALTLSPRSICAFNTGAGIQVLFGVDQTASCAPSSDIDTSLCRLLRATVSSLRSLHIDLSTFKVHRPTKVDSTNTTVLPALQELSISGDGRTIGPLLEGLFDAFAFPSLSRIRISSTLPGLDFQQLHRAAPVLEECTLMGWAPSLDSPLVFHQLLSPSKSDEFTFRTTVHVSRPSPWSIGYIHAFNVYRQVVAELETLAGVSAGRFVLVDN